MFSALLLALVSFLILYGHLPPLYCIGSALILGVLWYIVSTGHIHDHSGGFLSIDMYAQSSRLNRLNAGAKLIGTVAVILVTVGVDQIWFSLAVMVGASIVTVCVGGTPWSYYLMLLKLPVLFILASTLAIMLEFSPEPLGVLSVHITFISRYVCVTEAGQREALFVTARAFGSVACLYFLSLTTPMHKLIAALRRMKLPSIVIELMYLIYRYIFVMLEMHMHMCNSAASRLGYIDAKTTIKTSLNGSLNLLFLSFRRASDCFAAMESRCYDGEINFYERG